MSVDRSLRLKSSLARHRNVLTRAERIVRLMDDGVWTEDRAPLGLPKVSHRKGKSGKRKVKEVPGAEGEAK